jgi:hypothetical protein
MSSQITASREHVLRDRILTGMCVATVAVLATMLACSNDTIAPDASHEVDGPSVTVGSGSAHTFVTTDGSHATRIGIALTDGVFTNLPDSMAEYQLPLPAGTTLPPWDHATLNWNPHGHPPPNIYMVPPFDFHFYTIPVSAQMSIVGGPDTVPVPTKYMPRDYESEVESVPAMGVHWNDSLSAEWQGHPFDRTLIYGFNRGQLNFIEPMITVDFLKQHPDVTAHVKQPAAFQAPGEYPASYSIHYDATEHITRVALDSLVAH